MSRQDRFVRESESFRKQLSELQSDHEMAIERKRSEQQQEFARLTARFDSERNKIRCEIDETRSGGDSTKHKRSMEIERLQTEMDDIKAQFEKRSDEFTRGLEKEKAQLESDTQEEIHVKLDDCRRMFELKQESDDTELLKLVNDFDLKYEGARLRYDEEYLHGINAIRIGAQDKKEIEMLDNEFLEQLAVLETELNSIRNPPASSVLTVLDYEFQRLRTVVQETQNSVRTQTVALQDEWNQRIDLENCRHRGIDMSDYLRYESLDSLRYEISTKTVSDMLYLKMTQSCLTLERTHSLSLP